MGTEIQKAPEINLLKSEMEAAAARVAERAANLTVDGVSGLLSDVFGGLLGDRIKQWRNRNLVTTLSKSKSHFDRLNIPIENAKALPMGELYAIFDGISKQDDPQLSDMWSALLTNAMRPDSVTPIDPALPKTLEQLSGIDAVILKFYRDATEIRLTAALRKKQEGKTIDREDFDKFREYIKTEGEKIISIFGESVISSSIGNLIRLSLLYVETQHDESSPLVQVDIIREDQVQVSVSSLRDELSNIYYRLNLEYDAVEEHKIIHYYNYGDSRFYFLPYDLTRLSKRLLKACAVSDKPIDS